MTAGGHNRKLSDAQIDDLIARRERGWSYTAIAKHLGVSNGAVHYQCLRNAAVSPCQRSMVVPTQPSSFVAKDGRTHRRFTVSDDVRLLELEALGMNYGAIAREMGRAITSVRIRLMTIALREDLPA